jgi:hypothetical protein
MNIRRTILAALALLILTLGLAQTSYADPVFFDPVGDTFGSGTPLDIIRTNGTVSGSFLTFSVTFATAISPAHTGSANSVVGFIDIDTDQSAATGIPPFQGVFGLPPAPTLGDEFFIDLFSESTHPGFIDVVNALTSVRATVAITYTPFSFSFAIPLALLGGDDGIVNYGVIIGNISSPTDEAPNGTIPARSGPAAIPEPATLLLLSTGLVGVAGQLGKRLFL